MNKILALALAGIFPMLASAAEPWQGIVMPSVAEAAAAFPKPPMEYRAINWAIWGAGQTKEKLVSDIEKVAASGAGVYMINNSGGLTPKYFTPEHLDLVKVVIEECKKHGLKLWIEGDAGYPDGFAGGMISRDYPELAMQGIVADAKYTVAAGQTLKIPLPPDTLGILVGPRAGARGGAGGGGRGAGGAGGAGRGQGANGNPNPNAAPADAARAGGPPAGGAAAGGGRRGGGRAGGAPASAPSLASPVLPIPADGQFQWTAPGTGMWEITFVRHVFRSSPTRFTNREDGTRDKDSLYSLIDYLNPEATKAYIKIIHGTYEKLFGAEFGKTILGFRSDEPDYTGFMPWSPKLLETFQQQKGYDLKPYIPLFFATEMTPEATRAKADYWDVWSAMFRDNFFKPLQEWAEARNMHYMTHLNHEELMLDLSRGEDLIRNEGSFFRAMRFTGVPGIDNLNQIGPGIVADFPKLASSTAHLYGRPMVWTESGGGLGANGKFVTDYQLVRGINYLNVRGLIGGGGGGGRANANAQPFDPALAAATGWYASRASYLMTVGRPAAQVALFHPTDSMWLGDQDSDTVDVKLTTQLMEQQIDFDHIDSDTIASICTLEGGGLKNLSGQVYRAIIIPSSTVMEKNVLDRLRAFATAGGKVIFVGRTPTMLADKSFLNAGPAPELGFATLLEPTPDITPKVIAALPKPDVKLDASSPAVKYMHRSLKDGEVYFFFNESDQPQPRTATLAGAGQVQTWNASSGAIQPVADIAKANGSVNVPLALAPYESKFIVIGPMPAAAK